MVRMLLFPWEPGFARYEPTMFLDAENPKVQNLSQMESTTKTLSAKVASLSVICQNGFLIRINSKLIRDRGESPLFLGLCQLAARKNKFAKMPV